MRKIYKYELPTNGDIITIKQCIIKILSIQEQNGIPMMWAIVDPDNEAVEPLEIVAIGTGWTLPTGLDEYLGTAQDEYDFVWHYFSLKLKELKGPVEPSYMQLEDTTFAALAQSLGKVGISAEQAAQAFDMRGLFDARI